MSDRSSASRRKSSADGADKPPATIQSIVGGLRPTQLWVIGGAVVTVLLAAVSLGAFVEKIRSDSALFEKNTQIAGLEQENSSLQAALQAAGNTLAAIRSENQMLDAKSEFLNRYVSYLSDRSGVSKKLFADYICVMWRETQERRLHFDREALSISLDDLETGVTPEIEALLTTHGFDTQPVEGLLQKTVRPGVGRITRGVSRRAQVVRTPTVEKSAQSDVEAEIEEIRRGVRITKSVTFFDNTTYEVPEPVAIEVHTRDDCAPR